MVLTPLDNCFPWFLLQSEQSRPHITILPEAPIFCICVHRLLLLVLFWVSQFIIVIVINDLMLSYALIWFVIKL